MEKLFTKIKNAKGCDGCDLNLEGHSCLIVLQNINKQIVNIQTHLNTCQKQTY